MTCLASFSGFLRRKNLNFKSSTLPYLCVRVLDCLVSAVLTSCAPGAGFSSQSFPFLVLHPFEPSAQVLVFL